MTRDTVEITVTNGQDGASYPSIFTSLTLDRDVDSFNYRVEHLKQPETSQLRGYFTENVFTLLPGESKTVRFVPKSAGMTGQLLVSKLQAQLAVRSYTGMLYYAAK